MQDPQPQDVDYHVAHLANYFAFTAPRPEGTTKDPEVIADMLDAYVRRLQMTWDQYRADLMQEWHSVFGEDEEDDAFDTLQKTVTSALGDLEQAVRNQRIRPVETVELPEVPNGDR